MSRFRRLGSVAAVLASVALLLAQTAGAGHFHQLEVPDQVNAMLARFLGD